jgi:hypothetical protein
LPSSERGPEKRVVPVLPGGFAQDPAQMGVAGFGDRAARLFGAARVFGGHEAGKRPHPWRRGEAAGVAEFGGDGEGGEIVDAAETAQALDACAERLDGEQIAEVGIDGLQPAEGFGDRTDVGAMGLLKRRAGPALGLQPGGMAFGPGPLGGRESPPMAEEKFREPVSGA